VKTNFQKNFLIVNAMALCLVISPVSWAGSGVKIMDAKLKEAIDRDNAVEIAKLIAEGMSPNQRLSELSLKPTALEYAVAQMKKQAVSVLLKNKADPNLWDEGGAEEKDKAVLDKKYNGHYRNNAVTLALKLYEKDPEYFKLVIASGGSPNTIAANNDPIILYFLQLRNTEGLKFLKTAGADINVRNRSGDPLIIASALSTDWDMVWELIELGAKYDYKEGVDGIRYDLPGILKLKVPSPDSPLWKFKVKTRDFLASHGMSVAEMSVATYEKHQVLKAPEIGDTIGKELGESKFSLELTLGKKYPAYNVVHEKVEYQICYDEKKQINFIFIKNPFFKTTENLQLGYAVPAEYFNSLQEINGPLFAAGIYVDKILFVTLPSGWKIFTFTRKGVSTPISESHLQIHGFFKGKI
jgi:hypothetical protein